MASEAAQTQAAGAAAPGSQQQTPQQLQQQQLYAMHMAQFSAAARAAQVQVGPPGCWTGYASWTPWGEQTDT